MVQFFPFHVKQRGYYFILYVPVLFGSAVITAPKQIYDLAPTLFCAIVATLTMKKVGLLKLSEYTIICIA